jgi:hypothetical protein
MAKWLLISLAGFSNVLVATTTLSRVCWLGCMAVAMVVLACMLVADFREFRRVKEIAAKRECKAGLR